jgi:opacity protein-like surface antigen
LQETDLEAASGYLQTAASLDVIHWIRPDLRVSGTATYALNQYNGIARVDQVATVGLGVRRYVTPHFFFGADAAHISRDSTDIARSYNEAVVTLRAGAVQAPVYQQADLERRDVPRESHGSLYVGLQTSLTVIGTKLQGPRGAFGTLQADFAGDGWANSIFAGYGVHMGDWFLALEADVGQGSGGWDHAHVPDERIFSVSRRLNYGVSGVVGRTFAGGTMLYGKGGIVAARFETNYLLTPNSTRIERTDAGLRLGVGGSVPISSHFAVRLEHTFSTFKSYDINCCIEPPGGPPDNFSNDETVTSIGLVYRFNPPPGVVMPAPRVDFGGFYFGVQAGHEALWSRGGGPRESNTQLVADFGDTGFTVGGFAGYGLQFRSFYLGGELEAELSKTGWSHVREPSGRTFSIENDATYGAAIRAGYIVNNTALLYARVGVVQSQLDVNYRRGNNSIATEDWVTGLRFGGGMEFPVSKDLFLRLDYTHTNYRATSLITPPDQEIEHHRTRTDLFRLGVLRRLAAD